MNWKDFFEWLEKHSVKYCPGDMHYAGRGYWYPEPPDLGTGEPAPKPPEPWIQVERIRGETRADPETSVYVSCSFAPTEYAETPELAMTLIVRALMAFDSLTLGPPLEPRRYPEAPERPPQVRRGQRISDEAWERMTARTAQDRRDGKHVYSPPGSVLLPSEVLDRQRRKELAERRAAAELKVAEQSQIVDLHAPPKRKRKLGGIDNEGVSTQCDTGYHQRCTGCECRCH